MRGPDPFWRRPLLPHLDRRHRREVDDELQFHIEMRTKRLIKEGMGSEAAAEEARRRFGDPSAVRRTLLKEGRRAQRWRSGRDGVGSVLGDLGRSIRSLARTPSLTGAAFLILALGIGATTAVFALVETTLLTAAPVGDPERVLQVELVEPAAGDPSILLSPGMVLNFNDRVPGVAAATGLAQAAVALGTDELPVRIQGLAVTHAFWEVIAVEPLMGRAFTAEEDMPGAQPVVVLSHRLWTEELGADPDVLGRELSMNGVPTSVVGVMPPGLGVLEERASFWRPLRLAEGQRDNIGSRYMAGLVLLEEGIDRRRGEEVLNRVAEDLRMNAADGGGDPFRVRLTPLEDVLTREYEGTLFALLGGVILVLLIGCGNVATLLLARGAGRRRELAIRMAVGAGRARLVRLLVTEGLVLAGASAMAGLLLAWVGTSVLRSGLPIAIPGLAQVRLDPGHFLFAAGLAGATVLVFGVVPALKGGRVDVRQALVSGEGATGGQGRRPDGTRAAFLALQAALSLALLVGAGLLLRTARELTSTPPGYRSAGVLTGIMALPFSRYPDIESVRNRYAEIEEALRAIPGVDAVALGSRIPLAGGWIGYEFQAEREEADEPNQARVRMVGPEYFSTLGHPVLAGRQIAALDGPDGPLSVVINRAMAHSLGFDVASAVGRVLFAPGDGPFADPDGVPLRWTIVGVVEDTKEAGPRSDTSPEVFFPLAQVPEDPWNWLGRQLVLVLRTDGDPAALLGPMRQAVYELDPEVPIFDAQTLIDRERQAVARERFAAVLTAGFGLVGLVLAGTGIFGGAAYAVGRRRREIGIRLAMGAPPRDVAGEIIRRAVRPVLLGVGLGLPLAWIVARALRGLLFGVSPGDPIVFLGSAAILIAAAYTAAVVPARRAASIDPVAALGSD